jgi:hypothetical protein
MRWLRSIRKSTVRVAALGNASSSACSSGPHRVQLAEGRQLMLQHRVIGEGIGLGLRLEEEVERVDRRHVGHEVHRDGEVPHSLGEDDAGLEVPLRVLLPVDEVVGGLDLERVGQDEVFERAAPVAAGSPAGRAAPASRSDRTSGG